MDTTYVLGLRHRFAQASAMSLLGKVRTSVNALHEATCMKGPLSNAVGGGANRCDTRARRYRARLLWFFGLGCLRSRCSSDKVLHLNIQLVCNAVGANLRTQPG